MLWLLCLVVAPLAQLRTLRNEASQLSRAGQFTQAIPKLQQALTFAEEAPLKAQLYLDLAEAQREANAPEAVQTLETGEAFTRQHLGLSHPTYALLQRTHALLHEQHQEWEAALRLWQNMQTQMHQGLGPTHPSSIELSIKIASLLNQLGRYTQAQTQLVPHRAATVLRGELLLELSIAHSQDDPTQAWTLGVEALEEVDHSDSWTHARALNNLAARVLAQGQRAQALDYLERALAVSRNVFGPEHDLVHRAQHHLQQVQRQDDL